MQSRTWSSETKQCGFWIWITEHDLRCNQILKSMKTQANPEWKGLACLWKEICICCFIKKIPAKPEFTSMYKHPFSVLLSHWQRDEPSMLKLIFPLSQSSMQAGRLWTHGQNQNHCGNYSSCHHKIIWEPTELWHSIPHSLLSYAGLLWRQSSFLVLWENSKCKSNPSCPEHRALLSAKLLLMRWATTGLCGDGFMGGQMPKETFISVGWKEQQKFPKSREDQTGAKVLIHCFSFLFCLHF